MDGRSAQKKNFTATPSRVKRRFVAPVARAAASAPGDAKRCGVDEGGSLVVPLSDHPKARVGVPACETAGSPNSAAFSIRHNSGVRPSGILLHCRMPLTRGKCQLTAMIAIGPRW